MGQRTNSSTGARNPANQYVLQEVEDSAGILLSAFKNLNEIYSDAKVQEKAEEEKAASSKEEELAMEEGAEDEEGEDIAVEFSGDEQIIN